MEKNWAQIPGTDKLIPTDLETTQIHRVGMLAIATTLVGKYFG